MSAIMEARERISDKAEGHIVEHMGNRGNVVDRLAWLRAWRPAIWNPERKMTVDVQVNQLAPALDKASAYDAELVSPPTVSQPMSDGTTVPTTARTTDDTTKNNIYTVEKLP